ncbi:MAG: glycosyltransferase N-terminal domain-containing protein, partial [Planctomycetota bacterium]
MHKGRIGKTGGKAILLHMLYDFLFITALLVASPYFLYRICMSRRFRAGLIQRLGFVPRRRNKGRAIWLHGVSAGEIKTIAPLLNRIEQASPETECIISTTTLAGFQMAQKLYKGRFIFYYPLDISFIVQNVIRRVNPGFIILMELEIWPNLLYKADQWGAKVIIVNGRITERSYRRYSKGKRLLPELDRIMVYSVQNIEYRDRLLGLDVDPDKIVVTGNIKYDGIGTSGEPDCDAMNKELKLSKVHRVLVAGSTHSGEEEILLDIFGKLGKEHPDLRLIVAPRHIERVDEIEKACIRRDLVPLRRTLIEYKTGMIEPDEVLILDTIGELDKIYALADIVFVGGSLVPVGGHNLMEPA